MEKYFIGWHQPVNGKSGCAKFENCMISVNRLIDRKSAFIVNNWILDSGAFSRISTGKGHLSIDHYADQINKWSKNGNLLAAVVQDYMCEPHILSITGKTVKNHQSMTIENYDLLLPKVQNTYIMPVLQGYKVNEYIEHLNQYGSRLKQFSWVGVGSICKRNGNPNMIKSILLAIKTERPDLKLHGFGIKSKSLADPVIWDILNSADSQSHGLAKGRGNLKYNGSNDPATAIEYAQKIMRPSQLSIFAIDIPPLPKGERIP